ncbi:cell division protein FtsY-like protein [Hibiscus syriacus]|uniref:Cell division protein FtsY-like protein n=1 Tax=Hibiscus syriacus TaxID=106335 RepID=A0A6A2XZQ3_HIBSY|nr:cell division protein FtsY-like protein [Hibiscus syriacus]
MECFMPPRRSKAKGYARNHRIHGENRGAIGCMKIMDPVKFPATTAWMKRVLQHPIKDAWPPREKMIVYFHQRREALGSSSHESLTD